MDAEIFKLNKQTSKRQLIEFLNDTSSLQIDSLLKEKLDDYYAKNDADTILVLRAIFQGSPIEEGYIQRRFQVISNVIEWLSTENKEVVEKSKQASQVVNLVLPEIELLPTEMLRELGIEITKIIGRKEAVQLRILDIFSKVWNVLSSAEELNYLNDIFDELLKVEWNNQIVVGISSSLNEMELSNSQLEIMIKQLIKKLNDMEVEEVPPLIYQLLLLSRKGFKKVILNGILNYFNSNEEIDSCMEGTVILHLSFAIKQDKDLGNELIKLMKNDKSSLLKVFNIACLLSAARIHRIQDIILDLIKNSIGSIYKDKEKADRSIWISEYCSLDAEKYDKVLLYVVEKSALGWDQVIQSLTQLALILIDSSGIQKVSNLGIQILLRFFRHHEIIRNEILEQITSRIISRSDNVMEYLKLLKHIIQEYPDEIEKYLGNIKDTLDFLSFLPLNTAQHLISAIRPISKSNNQFRDGLILILRKSLFAKDLNSRQMAVNGFLNILNDQLNEIQSNHNNDNEGAESVVFEILGLLRRCFSQQYEIRLNTYQGLGSLSEEHTTFAADIFDLLFTQFIKTYEKDIHILNPIKLNVCIENATNGGYPKLLEPIHELIANIFETMYAIEEKEKNVSKVILDTLKEFKGMMKSFVDRLCRATLEDLEVDKTNIDIATHIGLKNIQYITILLGVYENAMEYEFYINGLTKNSSERLMILYKRRKELFGILNAATKKNNQFRIQSCVNFEFISKLFFMLFENETDSEQIMEIRRDIDFVQFIVSSTCESLELVIENEYCRHNGKYFELTCRIYQTYIEMLKKEDSDSTYANQSSTKKTPSVLISISNSIISIYEIVNRVWPNQFEEFLSPHLFKQKGKIRNRIIIETITTLKDIVQKYLSGRTPIYKEVSSVLHVVSYLCQQFDKKETDFSIRSIHVVNWLDSLAKERGIQDSNLAKDIISLLIGLGGSIGEFDTIQNMCEDIHLFTGDIDVADNQENMMEPELRYQIINIKTFSTITTQVFDFLYSSLDDLTWCTGRLKICAAEGDDEITRSFEKEYCKRITSLLFILSELVKAVLTDLHAESLFRILTKAYKTLLTFVKYKIAFPQDISKDFINVISKSGTEITEKMYKFLTVYGQSQQQETHEKKKGKRKEVNMKQKAKVQRESRMIPNLIFSVEQFERHLIQLSRKSKVDFMQYMKRSTSRDFIIQMDLIHQEESSDEENDKLKREINDESEEEEAGPSAKRARRNS